MPDTTPTQRNHGMYGFLRVPLFRLLAINLAAGTALAALLVGGLMALNPTGLRDLILADSSPGTALGLLLFGFFVTFGSAAMGTAIMAMGIRQTHDEPPRGPLLPVVQALSATTVQASRHGQRALPSNKNGGLLTRRFVSMEAVALHDAALCAAPHGDEAISCPGTT